LRDTEVAHLVVGPLFASPGSQAALKKRGLVAETENRSLVDRVRRLATIASVLREGRNFPVVTACQRTGAPAGAATRSRIGIWAIKEQDAPCFSGSRRSNRYFEHEFWFE
jgi:hypothetical protein